MGGFYRSGDISVDQTPNMKLMHILRKNGLTAWIETDAGGQDHLYVRGDRGLAYSPPREYAITPQQRQELMNAFEGSRLRKGYETFNKIVRKDFIPPESLTTAKASGINRYGVNSYTPVNMGLNGVVERNGYGRREWVGMRKDGRRHPGEAAAEREIDGLRVPTAGYIYRPNLGRAVSQNIQQEVQVKDVRPAKPVAAPRPERGKATSLNDVTLSAGNDTGKVLKDFLAEHGIKLDEKNNTMTVCALNARKDIKYDMSAEEMRKLMANGWHTSDMKELQKRLDIINKHVGKDFENGVTIDMLRGKDYVDLTYKPDAREYYEKDFLAYDKYAALEQQAKEERTAMIAKFAAIDRDPQAVNGYRVAQLLSGQGFFQNVSHGRQLVVGEIRADRHDNEESYETALRRHELIKEMGLTKETPNDVLLKAKNDIIQQLNGLHATDEYGYTSQDIAVRKADLMYVKAAINTKLENGIELPLLEKPKAGNYQVKNNTYTMTAVINDHRVEKNVSKEDYERFMALDDASKLKFFAKQFNIDIWKGNENNPVYSYDVRVSKDGTEVINEGREAMAHATDNAVDGRLLSQLKDSKEWYKEKGNEKVEVQRIAVERDPVMEGRYRMTAIVNGQVYNYNISREDAQKWDKSNDYERMKMFSKVSKDFQMRTIPGRGFNVGRAALAVGGIAMGGLLAGLTRRDYYGGVPVGRPYYPGRDIADAVLGPENMERARAQNEGRIMTPEERRAISTAMKENGALLAPVIYEASVAQEKPAQQETNKEDKGLHV